MNLLVYGWSLYLAAILAQVHVLFPTVTIEQIGDLEGSLPDRNGRTRPVALIVEIAGGANHLVQSLGGQLPGVPVLGLDTLTGSLTRLDIVPHPVYDVIDLPQVLADLFDRSTSTDSRLPPAITTA